MGGTTHGVGWGRRKYHPGQKKGDQTDYGEYNILVLEHLAGRGRRGSAIDLKSLVPHWQRRLSSPEWGAWRCSVTKQTLQQVEAGAPLESLGGMSTAMGMRSAAAIAALDTEAEAAAAARATSFTHQHEEAIKHGQTALSPPWRCPRSPPAPPRGRACWLWAARHSLGEAQPLGWSQPLPHSCSS